MRVLGFLLVSMVLGACPDARKGTPADGGGGAGAQGGGQPSGGQGSGGSHEGGSGAAGGEGPAPNFAEATATPLQDPGDEFPDAYGNAVAIDGDTLLVGAYRDYFSKIVGGAAHVFVREGDTFTPQDSLRAQNPETNDFFGWSVAVDGDEVVVGARGFSDPSDLVGAAYLFHRQGVSWVDQQRIQEDPPQEFGNYGRGVAVSGSYAIVGAPDIIDGRAWAYEKTGADWTVVGPVEADDTAENFGYAVAMDGDTAVIGSLAVGGTTPVAHAFVREGSGWTEQGRLVPGSGGDGFGAAVALSGDIAVVGSVASDGIDGPNGAYVFVRSGETWAQEAELTAEDSEADDAFGAAVAVSGNVAVVGAPGNDETGDSSGAAYVFTRSGETWSLQTKLLDPDPGDDARFGASVAIDGDVIVVGALNETTDTGHVVVFIAP